MKKGISALLAVVLSLALLMPALAAGTTFADISDPATQKNAAVLQMMGVIAGTGNNNFSPEKNLSRAEFCKMTVLVMGKGDQEPLYRNRTIFTDVLSNHWARGYINLAVTVPIGGDGKDNPGVKLIRGNVDGTFAPNRAITSAEAVTILMRLLGYADADAGMIWPKGYLDLAANVGLTKGLSLSANKPLTRAQAAQLFVTLLKTPQKGATPYYNTLGTAKQDIVLLSGNATADDGTAGALQTSEPAVYKTLSGVVPPSLVGTRGTLVTNAANKVVAFIPVGEEKTITVGSVQANWIVDETGKKHTVPGTTPAYTTAEKTTFDKVWMDLQGGMRVTLFFSAAGKIDGVYLGAKQVDTAMVARETGGANPFADLVDGLDYTIYRDGAKASVGDIALYDVGTYDPATRVLAVSSSKLTGIYENAWPNQQSPSKITIMGADLNVLPMALDDAAGFKIGQSITALLTADGQVAGVLAGAAGKMTNVGVLEKIEGTMVTVKLLNGKTVSGEAYVGQMKKGELVQVVATGVKKLSVSRLATSTNVTGTLDLVKRKMGNTDLTVSCRFYDKVSGSESVEIKLDDLTQTSIPSNKIWYVHQNTAGKIDVIVFNDATGDLYDYGLLRNGQPVSGGSLDGTESFNSTLQVYNAAHPIGGTSLLSGRSITKDMPGGIVADMEGTRAANVVTLKEEKNIRRSAFSTRDGGIYATLSSQVMRVSDKVQCYNAVTKTWFKDLADARAFSDNLTVYYDRSVSEGGKVRLVIAN